MTEKTEALGASVGDFLYHDFQPCTNPEHATKHCGFWNQLTQAECGRFREQHHPAPPWTGTPEIRAAVATALQNVPPLTDEDLDAIMRKRREALGWVARRGHDRARRARGSGRASASRSLASAAPWPWLRAGIQIRGGGTDSSDVPRLVAEVRRLREELDSKVRRLRSEEWLERVVAEYRELTPGGDYGLLAILRKHRDGR